MFDIHTIVRVSCETTTTTRSKNQLSMTFQSKQQHRRKKNIHMYTVSLGSSVQKSIRGNCTRAADPSRPFIAGRHGLFELPSTVHIMQVCIIREAPHAVRLEHVLVSHSSSSSLSSQSQQLRYAVARIKMYLSKNSFIMTLCFARRHCDRSCADV